MRDKIEAGIAARAADLAEGVNKIDPAADLARCARDRDLLALAVEGLAQHNGITFGPYQVCDYCHDLYPCRDVRRYQRIRDGLAAEYAP